MTKFQDGIEDSYHHGTNDVQLSFISCKHKTCKAI